MSRIARAVSEQLTAVFVILMFVYISNILCEVKFGNIVLTSTNNTISEKKSLQNSYFKKLAGTKKLK